MAGGPKKKITVDDIVGCELGSAFNTDPSYVGAVASKLGVAPAEVRAVMDQASRSWAATAFERFTGRKPPNLDNPRSMLQAVFGRGPRGGAVDTKAASKKLGVAPVTVRRWAAGTQKPSADHLKALKNAARRVTGTKSGRRRSTQGFRSSSKGRKALTGGGSSTVWVTGYQGPYPYAHLRWRTVRMDVTPDQIEDMLAAYEDGGIDGLTEWLTERYDREVGGWEFASIDDFGIGNPMQ